jgi:hypothetical protein
LIYLSISFLEELRRHADKWCHHHTAANAFRRIVAHTEATQAHAEATGEFRTRKSEGYGRLLRVGKGLGELLANAEEVFALIAARAGGTLGEGEAAFDQPTIVALQGQDFGTFERIDSEHAGVVTLDGWRTYVKRTHALKGAKGGHRNKGDHWLTDFLHSFRVCLGEAAWTDHFGEIQEEAEAAFHTIAQGGVLPRAALEEVQGGDLGMFIGMPS